VKAVLIVGHVATSHSGYSPTDAHGEHSGAWAADTHYGDVNGPWTDNIDYAFNTTYPELSNRAQDGKWDQDTIDSGLEIPVGRIDFANLPAFAAVGTEAALLRRYLEKNHKYRHMELDWQILHPTSAYERVTLFDGFLNAASPPTLSIYSTALDTGRKTASSLFGASPDRVALGNALTTRSKPSLFGVQAGSGWFWAIHNGQQRQVTSADLAANDNAQGAAFYALKASFMCNWDFRTNNFLRSMLVSTNYGLAAMWFNGNSWPLHVVALGDILGKALQYQIANVAAPNFNHHKTRELNVLGDPTLRLHALVPPSQCVATRNGSQVTLSWAAGEDGSSYHVYRAASADGPFTAQQRLTTAPLTSTSFADLNPPTGTKVYLVRGVMPIATGSGVYTNLSQGAFSNAVN
jgi:hypothetical protein